MKDEKQISRYPWTAEPWYTRQTAEWDKLEGEGWQFGAGPPLFHHVGIRMVQEGGHGAVFYVSKSLSPEQIHAALLELCGTFARALAAPHSGEPKR